MIQFMQAAGLSSLGFLLIGMGLFPDRLQPLSDALIEIANRISPSMLRSPRIESQTSWGLVAFGAAWLVATFLAYLL
jgi:hypothetical protein